MWPLVYIVAILAGIAAILRIIKGEKSEKTSKLTLILLLIWAFACTVIAIVPNHTTNYMIMSRANYDISTDRFGQKMFTAASPDNGEIRSFVIDELNAKEFDNTSITMSHGALIKKRVSALGLSTSFEFSFIDSVTYDSLKQTGLQERK